MSATRSISCVMGTESHSTELTVGHPVPRVTRTLSGIERSIRMLELELQLQHGQPPLVGITTSLLSFCQSIPRTQSNSLTTFPMLNSCAKAHGSLTEPSLFAVIPLRPFSHFLFAVLLRPQCLSFLPSSCKCQLTLCLLYFPPSHHLDSELLSFYILPKGKP